MCFTRLVGFTSFELINEKIWFYETIFFVGLISIDILSDVKEF